MNKPYVNYSHTSMGTISLDIIFPQGKSYDYTHVLSESVKRNIIKWDQQKYGLKHIMNAIKDIKGDLND